MGDGKRSPQESNAHLRSGPPSSPQVVCLPALRFFLFLFRALPLSSLLVFQRPCAEMKEIVCSTSSSFLAQRIRQRFVLARAARLFVGNIHSSPSSHIRTASPSSRFPPSSSRLIGHHTWRRESISIPMPTTFYCIPTLHLPLTHCPHPHPLLSNALNASASK